VSQWCNNNCPAHPRWASDGYCDDGGPGAEYNDCELGSDCADCGSRAPTGASAIPDYEDVSLSSCSTRLSQLSGSEPTFMDQSACASSTSFLTLGSAGNGGQCERSFNIFLLHFLLPSTLTVDNLAAVTLDLFIAQELRGGVVMRIDGLGLRGETEAQALAAQSPGDYYVGSTDPAASVTQIDAEAMPQYYGNVKPVSYSSDALSAYVKEMLLAGGAGKHIVFRISSPDDQGCAADECAMSYSLQSH